MDPDSQETKRRRVDEDTGPYSAEYQHQSQHHYVNAKTAKTDFVPPSTSGTSSEDFHFTAFQNTPTITGLSPIRFEAFMNEPTGETPRPEESEEPGPDKKEHKAEEDVSVRERHNSIGKRYRNKLNEQFENLEALLSQQQNPEEEVYNEGHQNTTARDMDSSSSPTQVKKRRRGRSVNKASLLEMAKVRIKTLTEQREMLIAEVEQLEKELAEEATKQQASGSHHET